MPATPISAAASSSGSAASATRSMPASWTSSISSPGERMRTFVMQETGGTRKTDRGRRRRGARRCCRRRTGSSASTVPASHITVGLQCGGSDGFSSITANPALGAAMDILVRHGGTAILSETPEIYGVEHTLTCRAASRAVGEKLIERIRWWKDDVCGRPRRADQRRGQPGQPDGRARQHLREVARLGDEGRHRTADGVSTATPSR